MYVEVLLFAAIMVVRVSWARLETFRGDWSRFRL